MKALCYFVTLATLVSFQFVFATELPDLIRCNQNGSTYQLVLVLRSPQLPDGVTAIGLKKGASVIFKVASQMYTDENSLLSLIQIPATANSKEAKLNLQTKVVNLKNFHLTDLKEDSAFNCQF